MTDQEKMAMAMTGQVPTEVAVTSHEGLQQMMAAYGKAAASDTETLAEIDIRKLIPSIGMSRDTETINATIADQALPQNGKRVIFLCFISVRAMRTLWPPEALGEKYGRPICTTGWVLPSSVKKNSTHGEFVINEDVPYPYEIIESVPNPDREGQILNIARKHKDGDNCYFDCEKCPYNQFGSMSKHDTKREGSRAKACNESRTYFVIPVERGERLPFEDEDLFVFNLSDSWRTRANPFGIGMFNVSFGTNSKQVESIALQAAVREMPQGALVFRVGNKHDTSGSFTIASMVPELQGFLDPKDFFGVVQPSSSDNVGEFAIDWVSDFVKRYARTQSVTAAAEAAF